MKKNVRILIVEDEFVTLDMIRDELEEIGYDISGTAMSAEKAITILEEGKTDIAILDIQIKGKKSGIWLGETIQKKYKIPFIFLTAYSDSETVRKAAATGPSGYLVKPFNQPDLYTSIEVALKNFARQSNEPQLSESHSKDSEELYINDAIFIKEKFVFKKLLIRDILYIEAFKNYLEIHTHGNIHNIRSTLKDFITLLPEEHFVQAHRSFVVNIKCVDQISGSSLQIGTAGIPITRTYKEEVLKRFRFLA